MPRADLTGMERKKTLSCGAVRLTKPSPRVARNMTMMAGAEITTVVRSIESSEPRNSMGAAGVKEMPGENTGQME